MNQQPEQPSRLDPLASALDSNALRQLRFMLNKGLRPVEAAALLEKTPPKERQLLWSLLNQENSYNFV